MFKDTSYAIASDAKNTKSPYIGGWPVVCKMRILAVLGSYSTDYVYKIKK